MVNSTTINPAAARPLVPLAMAINLPTSDYGSPMRVMSELADAIAIQKAKAPKLFSQPWDAFCAPNTPPLLKRLRRAVDAREVRHSAMVTRPSVRRE